MYQLEGFRKLAEPHGFLHGFSTREEGNLGFNYGRKGEVIFSRGRFTRAVHSSFYPTFGIGLVPQKPGREETIVFMGPECRGRGMHAPDSGPFAEAVIARAELDGFLFVAVGDCLPIMVADPRQRIFALIHAGRESTGREISRKTVEIMVGAFRVRPADLIVGIGPGVRQDSYVLQTFPPAARAGSPWQRFAKLTEDGIALDLAGYNRHLFESLGVPPEQIDEAPVDTFTDERFASHRRSKATGEPEWRHACAFGLAP